MHFISLKIPDVIQIRHQRHPDERGDFMELFRHDLFTRRCGDFCFVQDNLSRSRQGTLRGLHYQRQRPQGKLIQVLAGTIFDVAVDVRAGSPTLGQWVGGRSRPRREPPSGSRQVLPTAFMFRANGPRCSTNAPIITLPSWKPPFTGRIRHWLLSGPSWTMCHYACQRKTVTPLSGNHLIFRARYEQTSIR